MSATQATDAPAGQPTARPEQPDVFLSYSRKDSDFARRLGEALAARDKEVWADWEDIPATAEWRGEIASGIDAADSFAFVISPDSLRSEECGKELAHALEHGKRIVPLLYRDANGLAVPPELSSRNWIFFRAEDDFHDAVDTFVEALETDLDWVRAHTRLLVRAREWELRNHDKSLLLRGSDLREAEHRLASVSPQAEPQPTQLQREYTLASRRAQSRRQRITIAAVGIALAVTVVLAVLAWIQRNDAIDNAHTARSRELATAAAGQLETNPELSVLLARQAVDQKRTAEAENVLRRALSLSNVIATTVPHGGWVAGVSFSRDGRRLLTASRDATARISDAATGRRLVTFRGHKNWVPSAVFSPDEQRVLTASSDGTARIWDAGTGKQLLVLSGHRGRVTRAEFSRDGARVVTCGLDHTARIWDAQTGEQLVVLRGHRKWVTRALFDASGTRVATASDDGTARIWDATTGEQLQLFDGGGGFVLALALSPDGARLATGSTNGTARLWRVSGGPPIELQGHVPGKVITYAAFSPDGARLATASSDTTARVWDGRTGTFLFELRGHTDAVTSVTFSRRDGLDRDGLRRRDRARLGRERPAALGLPRAPRVADLGDVQRRRPTARNRQRRRHREGLGHDARRPGRGAPHAGHRRGDRDVQSGLAFGRDRRRAGRRLECGDRASPRRAPARRNRRVLAGRPPRRSHRAAGPGGAARRADGSRRPPAGRPRRHRERRRVQPRRPAPRDREQGRHRSGLPRVRRDDRGDAPPRRARRRRDVFRGRKARGDRERRRHCPRLGRSDRPAARARPACRATWTRSTSRPTESSSRPPASTRPCG